MSAKKDYYFSYKKSGVDVKKANKLLKKVGPIIHKTNNSDTIGGIGGFGGLYKINTNKYKNPLLVAATDGVGTKLLIARKLNQFNTIGIDLVAMSVNDVIVQGAKPLFFLDYLAINKLSEKVFMSILRGIAKGCKEADCALIGGETAELPGVYPKGGYDLAGFCVGIVDKKNLLPNANIKPGDCLLALPSSGIHSNGFSLIRKILNEKKYSLSKKVYENQTIGQLLIKPTKIYVKPILKALNTSIKISALAHITGGGIADNLKRVLSKNLGFTIYRKHLAYMKKNNIFSWIKSECRVSEHELLKTFNCGLGMIIIVSKKNRELTIDYFKKNKQKIMDIGVVTDQKKNIFI